MVAHVPAHGLYSASADAHSREDVVALLSEYGRCCRRLGKSLPTRVCTDHGARDLSLIHSSDAFPDAHVNVDTWHFLERFRKTLNKTSVLCNEVHREFSRALYTEYTDADGKVHNTHAEPQDVIAKVDRLISKYSNPGSSAKSVITKQTVTWWDKQRDAIVHDRICSHPAVAADASDGQLLPFSVATSALENYHRQLNRKLQVARCSKDSMHSLLMFMMFCWNLDRLRAVGEAKNWGTFDLLLVEGALQSSIRAFGTARTAELWGVDCVARCGLRRTP